MTSMAPSTRTPTTAQTQVLFAVANPGKLSDAGDKTDTGTIHTWITKMAHAAATAAGEVPAKTSQLDTFKQLNACSKHEWLEQIADANPFDNGGSHLSWAITTAGTEALGRGRAAIDNPNPKKEATVDSTITAPPEVEAPEDLEPAVEEAPEVDPALAELDEGSEEELDGGEPEVEEPVENHVVEGSNQLSLKIGGPKPVSSILKVKSKQQKFGSTREFKMGELIEVTATIRVDSVLVKQEATGHVARVQTAVFDSFVMDGVELAD